MTKFAAAEVRAREILAPAVARAVEAAEEAGDFTVAQQLQGWVDDAVNNEWRPGVSGEKLAAEVAASFDLSL